MLFYVNFAQIIACVVQLVAASIEGARGYDACVDELARYESPVACILDWGASQGLALMAYADCLGI